MIALNDFRYWRSQASKGLWRKKNEEIPNPMLFCLLFFVCGFSFIAYVFLTFKSSFFTTSEKHIHIAYLITSKSFLLLLLFPFISIIWGFLISWKKNSIGKWFEFPALQRLVADISVAFYATLLFQSLFPWLKFKTILFLSMKGITLFHNEIHAHHVLRHPEILSTYFYFSTPYFTLAWTFFTLSIDYLMRFINKIFEPNDRLTNIKNLQFGLWLGESTGNLSDKCHRAGMASGQQVALFYDDCAQNILILGAIGTGKTTRIIHPCLLQLLDQDCGGLIFDIKGDFQKSVDTLAKIVNRPYHIIGVGREPINLLADLTPEIAASFLKSAFLLGSSGRTESFWIDTATELCRNVLGILSYSYEHYTLQGLYHYLFDSEFRTQRLNELNAIKETWNEPKMRLFQTYHRYETSLFKEFDEKVQTGVKATIAQVLSPFNHPELLDTFCHASQNTLDFTEMLEGSVFLIDLPLSRWGLGAKVVYTFLKLRFFNLMQQRLQQPHWNQERYVFFMCDEYQEIISANKDGLSDLNFWDKSRSSKTIGVVSAQSISSFYAAIGDRDLANAILQNFRQKICFRTEDRMTIEFLNTLLGNVEVERVTHTRNKGKTTSWNSWGNSHAGKSTSTSIYDKPLLDGQFFRELEAGCALVLLSFNGMAFDDVLRTKPIYV